MAEPDAGPGRRWILEPGVSPGRLDVFLAAPERLGSRRRAARALERGQVFLNGRPASAADAGRRIGAGDVVHLWIDRPGSAHRRMRVRGTSGTSLRVLYEDDHLIVLDKPPGLLTVPLPTRPTSPSVATLLAEHLRSKSARRPLVVHRIDRDTSGLVVFATSRSALQDLERQFRRHEPERQYLAVVSGIPQPERGTWRDWLVWDDARREQRSAHARDPRAVEGLCHYRLRERLGSAALLEIELVTGRRNQIRLQASLHGHPLIGERQYAPPDAQADHRFPRQALHAWRLRFQHPLSGEFLIFEAPLPSDLAHLVRALRVRPRAHIDGP